MLDYGRNDSKFIDALEKLLSSEKYTSVAENIMLVDVSSILDEPHYHALDGHLKFEGNKVIADEILKVMK